MKVSMKIKWSLTQGPKTTFFGHNKPNNLLKELHITVKGYSVKWDPYKYKWCHGHCSKNIFKTMTHQMYHMLYTRPGTCSGYIETQIAQDKESDDLEWVCIKMLLCFLNCDKQMDKCKHNMRLQFYNIIIMDRGLQRDSVLVAKKFSPSRVWRS